MRKMINNLKKMHPVFISIVFFILVLFTIFSLYGFVLNNDFWFLINTGKVVLKDGFINVEPFTIHSGLSFIPQQWLTDVIFYLIYDNFGIRGMYTLVLFCSIVLLFVFYKMCFIMNSNKKRSLIIAILVNLFLIYTFMLTSRPQLFDIVAFSIELLLLELFIKKEKNLYLYFIPLLSILIINYHSSMWIMFFVLLVPYYIEYIILRLQKKTVFKIKLLIIITIISIACGLINPYGLKAITYLFNSYGYTQINKIVFEMKPVNISGSIEKVIFLVIFILLYSFYANKNKNCIRHFLLCLGLSYLTLLHYRGVLFLAIIIPIILGYNFKNIGDKKEFQLFDKIVYIGFIMGLLILFFIKVPLGDGVFIKEFADYLDMNATKDIKLFTDYNNGDYMEYRGYKCYIDARAEVFLKANNHVEDIFTEYYDLEANKLDVPSFLDKYQFDYLLVDDTLKILLIELRANDNYIEVLSKVTDVQENITTYLFKRV